MFKFDSNLFEFWNFGVRDLNLILIFVSIKLCSKYKNPNIS